MKSILIYSSVLSERLQYILEFFWKTDCELTDSIEEFKNNIGPKICYSSEKIDAVSLWIMPFGLLEKDTIERQSITVSQWENLPIFFQPKGDLPFDIFSASFYLISRYEEYLPHQKDQYGRFSEKNALALREGFLQLPLVDLWFQELENKLKEIFSTYKPTVSEFRYIPTFDIDIPFAFLHKPLYVQIGALAKNILKNKTILQQQIATWRGKMPDPYDNFSLLESQMNQYHFDPIYFFPVAKKHGQYDKNPSQSNTVFQQLIKTQSQKVDIGIHPSWHSGGDKSALFQEKDYLEKVSEKQITKSRQHFIRMTLPTTYQNLIELGIEEDFSMGYGNIDGFRASTTKPFYWFDLSRNKATTFKIHPFCWMDATAFHHTKDNLEKVSEKLQYYFETIQNVDGQMITVMHNNYFASTPDMLDFRNAILFFWEKTFSSNAHSEKI